MRLWNQDAETPEGKYPIVLRRDGSVLPGPYFVLALRDPCAAAAIRAYADTAEERRMDPTYVADLRTLASQAEVYATRDPGDPDAPRHRTDDPAILAWARTAHGGHRGSA